MVTQTEGPKERLIEAALKLFYQQGYQATGINQLIKEAGVAKASFYDHFEDKEDLCVAFLERRHDLWMKALREGVASEKGKKSKLESLFSYLQKWIENDGYRGCGFLNMASEFCDPSSKVRKVISWHKDSVRSYVKETVEAELRDRDLSEDEVESIASQIYVIIDGGVTASQVYHDSWPLKAAGEAAEKILAT